MKKYTSESGRSMVEMLGVIAIIGVISVGGITSMSYVDSYFRTSSTLLEVDGLARDIVDMCSWSQSFAECGLSTNFLKDEGVLSSDKNRWGGDIEVTPIPATETTPDSFQIQFTQVPESVAEQMEEETATGADGTKHLMRAIKGECNNGCTVTFTENLD